LRRLAWVAAGQAFWRSAASVQRPLPVAVAGVEEAEVAMRLQRRRLRQ
jgi:hypothetical protein